MSNGLAPPDTLCIGFYDSNIQANVYQARVLAGFPTSFDVPIKIGSSSDGDMNPIAACSKASGGGGLGGYLTLDHASALSAPSVTIPGGYPGTVTAIVLVPTGSNPWKLHITITPTAGTLPQTLTGVTIYTEIATAHVPPFPDLYENTGGEFNLTVFVQSVYEEVGFFHYPSKVDGLFHILPGDRLAPSDYVDFTRSGDIPYNELITPAPYKPVFVGRLSQAAVDNPTQWQSTKGLYKSHSGSVGLDVWYEPDVIAYPVEWYANDGDPFTGDTSAQLEFKTANRASTGAWDNALATAWDTVNNDYVIMDGYPVLVTDVVLFKDQVDQSKNGLYKISGTGPAAVWVRNDNMNSAAEVARSVVRVDGGYSYSGDSWVTYSVVTNLEVDDIVWESYDTTYFRVLGTKPGSSYFPPELPDLETTDITKRASSYIDTSGNNTGVNIGYLEAYFYTNTAKTATSASVQVLAKPNVKSLMSTTSSGSGTVGQSTHNVWGFTGATSSVTLYPAVYNDLRQSGGLALPSDLKVALDVQINGGAWTALTIGTTATYHATLDSLDPLTYTITHNGDVYEVAQLTFTALQPGTFKLRTRPTVDANLNVRSTASTTSDATITAYAKPIISMSVTGIPSTIPATPAFTAGRLNVSCNIPYAVTIIPPAGGYLTDYDNIGLYNGATLLGRISAPAATASFSAGTTQAMLIDIPVQRLTPPTSLPNQSFTGIFTLVATQPGTALTYTQSSGTFAYSRSSSALSVSLSNPTLDLGVLNKCALNDTATFTAVITWTNQVAGTVLTPTVTDSGGAQDTRFSTPAITIGSGNTSSSQTVTTTFTNNPLVPRGSGDTARVYKVTSSVGPVVATPLTIRSCTAVPDTVYMQTYTPSDPGIVLVPPSSTSGIIGSVTFGNVGPSSWIATSSSDASYPNSAFIKIRVGSYPGVPDTTNKYTVEMDTVNTFNSANFRSISPGAGSSWDLPASNAYCTISSSRQPFARGSATYGFVADEVAIRITALSANITATTQIFVRVLGPSPNYTPSGNYSTTLVFPTPVITDITGKSGVTLSLESGTGMFLSPEIRGFTAGDTTQYFNQWNSGIFQLYGSSGLFETVPYKELHIADPTPQKYLWWETVQATTGSFNITVRNGSTIIYTVPCTVVAKAINLRFPAGGIVSSISSGETINLLHNAGAVTNFAYNTAKYYGFIGTTITSGTPSVSAAVGESDNTFIYGVLSSKANGGTVATVVAVRAVVAGVGCSLVASPSSASPSLVPAIIDTCYPPFIPELNGLKLPNQITLSDSTVRTVNLWRFGTCYVEGGTPLNFNGVTDRIGHPNANIATATDLLFQLVLDGSFYKLRLYNGSNALKSSLSTPLNIVMVLQAVINGVGCVFFTKTLNVATATCSTLTMTDLSSSAPMYSCDMYLRTPTLTGTGYESGAAISAIHSFIEDGFAIPVGTARTTTSLLNYGVNIVGSKITTDTDGTNKYIPVKKYSGVNLDNYPLYLTTDTTGTCPKKVYKIPYFKNYAGASTYLPIPTTFFIGTSTTGSTSVPRLYNGDRLSVQLPVGVASLITSRLATDYTLRFSPVGSSAPVVDVFPVVYTEAPAGQYQARTISYTLPANGAGWTPNAKYQVVVLHNGTGCGYSSYSPSTGDVGTVTYMGVKPSASGVTFPNLQDLAPCFQTVSITGAGTSGLENVRFVTLKTPAGVDIAGWTELPYTSAAPTSFTFNLPRNTIPDALPTVRSSAVSKPFKVDLLDGNKLSLLAGTGYADITLKLQNPIFFFTQTNTNLSPTIGDNYTNVVSITTGSSTCCDSCSAGTCNPADLGTATIAWTSSGLPAWLDATAGSTPAYDEYTLDSNVVIPDNTAYNVLVSANVTYYNTVWPVKDSVSGSTSLSIALTPTSEFVIGTTSIPPTINGTVGYTGDIFVSNKPSDGSGCSSLLWEIIDRQPGAAERALPDEVVIYEGTDHKGVVSWPLVADAGAVFPYTYVFTVKASCQGGNAAVTDEKTISLLVNPSQPKVYSHAPDVGYFDITNEQVLIVGEDFDAGTTVLFGSQYATIDDMNGAFTEITCTPPTVADLGGPDLDVDILITNGDGGWVRLVQGYKYRRQRAPILMAISPSSGTPFGGTKVMLTGANFEPSSVVTIDGVEQPILAITPSSLLFVTNPHSVGTVDVVVSNSSCGGTLSVCPSISYTFRVSPQILAVAPFNTSASGGEPVFITGTGFYQTDDTKPRVTVNNFEIPPDLIVYTVV